MSTRCLILLNALIPGVALLFTAAIAFTDQPFQYGPNWVYLSPVVVCLLWLAFAVGLLSRRMWAWWGSTLTTACIAVLLAYKFEWPLLASHLGWSRPNPHSDPDLLFAVGGMVFMAPIAGALILLFEIRRQLTTSQ